MSYHILVNDALAPEGPFRLKKDAEAALAKRQAKDQAVDNPIQYVYKILKEA